MKLIFIFITLFSFSVLAQDPKIYLSNFDSKIYSLKTKGVKDFVVDIESSRLTKQLNEQMIFGPVKKLVFKTYWTLNPERFAIEIIGLPEGFKEIKEELKLNIMAMLDHLVPIPVQDRFAGYQISAKGNLREFIAKDKSGIAVIPSYTLKFDQNDMLSEVIGHKMIGTFQVKNKYERPSLADGKWLLISQTTTTSENGQSAVSTKELSYGTSQGVTVLSRIDIVTEQKWGDDSRPLTLSESLEFKNYKINNGDALKYFLGENTKR